MAKRSIAFFVFLVMLCACTIACNQCISVFGEESADSFDDDDDVPKSVVVNEICASNQTCLYDENGKAYDWIELYNTLDTAVDLSGYGVSKKESNPYQLTIPSGITIGSHDYLVIFCNKNTGITLSDSGQLYAPFNIGADGETIYLTDAAGETVDTVAFSALKTDDTYGRYPDGDGNQSVMTPTPGASNDNATLISYVDDPIFSVESGFYDEAFDLELDVQKGTEIYYTLDNSDPRTSDTAIRYDGAISIYDNTDDPNVYCEYTNIRVGDYTPPDYNIDKGIVVRAVAVDEDGFYSNVLTKDYFVGKDAEYYDDLMVVSISTESENLFDDETGIYVTGNMYDEYIADEENERFDNVNNSNWVTNYNQSGREWERPANVQFFENGELAYEADCGIRLQGHYTRGLAQKSFRLYARSEYGTSKFDYAFFDDLVDINGDVIDSFDKLQISAFDPMYDDTLRFKSEMFTDIFADLDVASPEYRPCVVFLEGEFWGVYLINEKLDADFVESHYDIDSDDVTVVKNGNVDDGDEDLWQEYRDFRTWAAGVDFSDDENYAVACEMIDMQSLMDYITIQTYLYNYDWASNQIIWRSNTVDPDNPYADGKWRFMLYDLDYTCLFVKNDRLVDNLPNTRSVDYIGELFYEFMDNATFREQFYETYYAITDKNMDSDSVCAWIENVEDVYRAPVVDTLRRYSLHASEEEAYYDKCINGLKDFFIGRRDYALKYLDDLYALYPVAETEMSTTEVSTEVSTEISTATTTHTEAEQSVTTEVSTEIDISDASTLLRGDINLDGEIDPTDAYLLLVYYANLQLGTDPVLNADPEINAALLERVADINGDGEIDPTDAYYVLTYYAKSQLGTAPTWEEILA